MTVGGPPSKNDRVDGFQSHRRNGWRSDGLSPRGIGFGLGVQVVDDPVAADRRVSKGAWGWAGAYGTNVHIEPATGTVTIILMQTSTPALQRDFENAVAQAIVK